MADFLLQCTPALCCFSVMLHNVSHLGGMAPCPPLNPPLNVQAVTSNDSAVELQSNGSQTAAERPSNRSRIVLL